MEINLGARIRSKQARLSVISIACIAFGVFLLQKLPGFNVPNGSTIYYLVVVTDILVIIFFTAGLLLTLAFPFIAKRFPLFATRILNLLENV